MTVKSYKVECHIDNEYADCPGAAVFDIDEETAREIARLANLVKENDLYTVERWDCRVTYFKVDPDELEEEDEENELRTECDILCVTKDEFWFRCYQKHCDPLITTEGQKISELLQHFTHELATTEA